MHLKKKKKIVFIGHEASLSGAPVLLLNLLLLLREDDLIEICLVIKRSGPILKDYENYFSPIVLKGDNYGKEPTILKRIFNVVRNRIQMTRFFFKAAFSDVIFSNTITNGRLLKTISPFRQKIVTYVHELENVIEWYKPSGNPGYSLLYSKKFAYPSLKVAEVLEHKYNVHRNRLSRLQYYFPVDLTVLNDEASKRSYANAFRERYNLSGEIIIGNVGVLCKRKGADIFIKVCRKVTRVLKNIKFCWIGQFEDREIEAELMELIREQDVTEHIVLPGPVPHYYYNFCAFDLLFLASREDPYPLVVIEAALMKVPTICYKNSGGIAEFVDNDAGWLIEDYSVDVAAQKIIDLFNNGRHQILDKGENACKKAFRLHADPDVIRGQFNELINSL